MQTTMGRTEFVRLQRKAKREYRTYRSFRKVARIYGVSVASMRRVILGYEPRHPTIRAALGLPTFVTIAACSKCGRVHDLYKVCPDKRHRTRHSDRRISDMPTPALAWKFRNRTDYAP